MKHMMLHQYYAGLMLMLFGPVYALILSCLLWVKVFCIICIFSKAKVGESFKEFKLVIERHRHHERGKIISLCSLTWSKVTLFLFLRFKYNFTLVRGEATHTILSIFLLVDKTQIFSCLTHLKFHGYLYFLLCTFLSIHWVMYLTSLVEGDDCFNKPWALVRFWCSRLEKRYHLLN